MTAVALPLTRRRWPRLRHDSAATAAVLTVGVFVLCAIAAPLLAPYSPTDQALGSIAQGPSRAHPFGRDGLGRDELSRVIWGARATLGGALASVGVAALVGVPLGLLVGYVGGALDELVMRTTDGVLAFPYIVIAVLLVVLLGPGLPSAIVAAGISSVPGYTRLIRGVVLGVREQEYVHAAGALGASRLRIALRHILPNSIPPIIVYASLDMAAAIVKLTSLSFIGLGAQPPRPEWGLMLSDAQQWLTVAPHISIVPGVMIVSAVVAFSVVGDYLRDALDPRTAPS